MWSVVDMERCPVPHTAQEDRGGAWLVLPEPQSSLCLPHQCPAPGLSPDGHRRCPGAGWAAVGDQRACCCRPGWWDRGEEGSKPQGASERAQGRGAGAAGIQVGGALRGEGFTVGGAPVTQHMSVLMGTSVHEPLSEGDHVGENACVYLTLM